METLLPYLQAEIPQNIKTVAVQSKGRATIDGLTTINELLGTDFPVSTEPFDRTDEMTDSRGSLHSPRC